jgi:protein-S-isoprenylcysteine O-methyltransferase Ste14
VTRTAKLMARRVLGENFTRGFYRLLYTIFSVLTTIGVIWLIIQIPDHYIWQGPAWFRWPMHAVQVLGLALGYFSFAPFDTLEFLGLRQAWAYLSGRTVEGDMEGVRVNRLVTTGLYRMVRNPMYLGGLLIFTFEPNITRNWLTVSILADMYFIWGAWIEQKRMIGRFGEEYRNYMKKVPLIIPTFSSIKTAIKSG